MCVSYTSLHELLCHVVRFSMFQQALCVGQIVQMATETNTALCLQLDLFISVWRRLLQAETHLRIHFHIACVAIHLPIELLATELKERTSITDFLAAIMNIFIIIIEISSTYSSWPALLARMKIEHHPDTGGSKVKRGLGWVLEDCQLPTGQLCPKCVKKKVFPPCVARPNPRRVAVMRWVGGKSNGRQKSINNFLLIPIITMWPHWIQV